MFLRMKDYELFVFPKAMQSSIASYVESHVIKTWLNMPVTELEERGWQSGTHLLT